MASIAARRYVEVGAKIRAARLSRGFSQERFAPVIGITRRHLIRLENGEHHPSSELRERIAEATGTDADALSADDAEAAQVAPAAAGSLLNLEALDALLMERIGAAVEKALADAKARQ